MNKKIIAIAAVAVLSGLAVVSCGNDVAQDSEVSVALPKVTAAQDEKATTQSGETTKANSKTTAVVVSGSGENSSKEEDTTKNTETTAAEDGETKTDGDTNANTVSEEPQVVETPTEQQTEPTPVVQPQSKTVYSVNDINQLMSDIESSFSETPIISTDGGACIPRGDEGGTAYIYSYTGISFTCYSNGGAKYINNITMKSPTFSTDYGIKVGDSVDAVKSVYGEPINDGNNIMYSFGNKILYFVLNGDTVSQIQINLE